MLTDLVADLDEGLASRKFSLGRLEDDRLDGKVFLRELAPTVGNLGLLPSLAGIRLGFLAQLLELLLKPSARPLLVLLGTRERVENRAESELELGGVDALGLLAKELALEPRQLEQDGFIELSKGFLGLLCIGASNHFALKRFAQAISLALGSDEAVSDR
jgi:hypothetical protein